MPYWLVVTGDRVGIFVDFGLLQQSTVGGCALEPCGSIVCYGWSGRILKVCKGPLLRVRSRKGIRLSGTWSCVRLCYFSML